MQTILTPLVACCALTALTTRAPVQDPALLPKGVTPEIAKSIDAGLQHLARTQHADGSWRTEASLTSYPTAMTALAGTALLASGSTPTRGRYWRNVRRAADYLLRSAMPNGLITSPDGERQSMFGHGFATLFLAQVYGMEEDRRRQRTIHGVLERAVRLIASSQSSAGGWYYSPDSADDEGSVTVTQVQALRACRNAGILVPAATISRAVGYIRDSANPDGGIRYRARVGGASRPAITAAAVAVLYNAGRYDDPMAERALEYAVRMLPVTRGGNGHHFYSHLYLAQALFQRGGEAWDSYYTRIAGWLRSVQRQDGSWVGDGVGTTYGTAIALIVLQLPFMYVPIYQR